jgi:hypothetical protein
VKNAFLQFGQGVRKNRRIYHSTKTKIPIIGIPISGNTLVIKLNTKIIDPKKIIAKYKFFTLNFRKSSSLNISTIHFRDAMNITSLNALHK